ncbi:tyrosine-type recombinase/integrase [Ferroacidibacillus organovorans]|uniref:Uncharacterized protein n=1 Tax=Ferroacidibacillus organovorans TaxID=1765683 RepID=A0A124IWD3_9BACL|nr:tyrosine-type recombinase/integrase [Ferroacidibacillus organovorans]KUO97055.1 hypothetical protein ATW55_12085 [Ferroacidibacillus organovorans]
MAKKTLEQFRDDIAIAFKRGKAKVPRKSATERFKRTHTHSHATTHNYARIADAFARFVYEQHGVTDLRFVSSAHGREFIEHCFTRFQEGELAAGTAKTYVHALSKLQNLAREQMRTRIRMINKDEMLARAKEIDAVRRLADAHKGLIITREQAQGMVELLAQSRSPNATVFSEMARFGMETGASITAALLIQVQDIDFKQNCVIFWNDKGGKDRVVQVDLAYMRHLAHLVEGRAPGRAVFEIRRQNGSLHRVETARKMAENLYRGQAEKIGLRGANFHSQRKAFANSRYNQYKETNYKVLERDLSRRLSQSAQLAQKMARLESRAGARHGAGRHFSHDQLARILVSMDLGHERLDVLRFYLGGAE